MSIHKQDLRNALYSMARLARQRCGTPPDSFAAFVIRQLVDHGLSTDDTVEVFGVIKNHASMEAMRPIWDKNRNTESPTLPAVTWLRAKTIALEWIDANKPAHQARWMFLPDKEREALFGKIAKANTEKVASGGLGAKIGRIAKTALDLSNAHVRCSLCGWEGRERDIAGVEAKKGTKACPECGLLSGLSFSWGP